MNRKMLLVIVFLIALAFFPVRVQAFTYGNLEAHLITTELAGIKYTPYCLGECHLPIRFKWAGSDFTLQKSELRWIKQKVVGLDNVQNVKARYLKNETFLRPECVDNGYYDTLPNGTDYWVSDVDCQNNERWYLAWKDVPSSIPIKQNKWYYVDFILYKNPSLQFSAVDIVPEIKSILLSDFAWLNTSFMECKNITIDNTGNGNTLTDWQVFVNLTFDSDMNADFSDIRFSNTSCNHALGVEVGELDYWIEQKVDSAYADVWVKVDSIPASSKHNISVYFDYASANSISDMNKVMVDGDPYDDASFNATKWGEHNTGDGSTVESGGNLNLTCLGTGGKYRRVYAISAQNATVDGILEGRMLIDSDDNANGIQYHLLALANNVVWSTDDSSNIQVRDMNSDNVTYEAREGGSSQLDAEAGDYQTGVWMKFKIVINSGSYTEFWKNGTLMYNNTGGPPDEAMGIVLSSETSGAATDQTFWTAYDYVFVRNFTSPEPTTSVGSSEAYGGDLPPIWSSNTSSTPTNYNSDTYSTFNITWANGSTQTTVNTTNVNLTSNYSGSNVDYNMSLISGNDLSGVYGFQEILGVGTYYWNSTAINNESSPQSNTTDTWYFTISQSQSDCTLTISPSNSETYPTSTTPTCSCNTTAGTVKLYRNNTDVTATENNTGIIWGAGTNDYVCNITSTQNYSSASDSDTLTITQSSNEMSMWINDFLSQNVSQTNSTVNVSAYACDGSLECTVYLFENGTQVNFSDGAVPAWTNWTDSSITVGQTRNFSMNATGNANYSANSSLVTYWYTYSPVLSVDVLDEQTEIGITFNITLQNSTFSFTDYNQDFFSANNTNMPYGGVSFIVWATGYPQRNYYLNIDPSSTETITAYLLQTGEGQEVLFYIYSYYEQPIVNASVDIQKLMSGGWNTTAQGRTDDTGGYPFFLDTSVEYRINIVASGYQTKNTTIIPTETEYKIYLTGELAEIPSFWDYWKNITYACNYTNSTRLLQCNWTDTSNHLTRVWLEVKEMNLTNEVLLCNNTSTLSSGTTNCTFPAPNNRTYMWTFYGEFASEPTDYIFASGSWTDMVQVALGMTGVIAAFIIILTSGFIGIQFNSPIFTIVTTMISVAFSYILGFLTIPSGAVLTLIGFGIAGSIMIFKMR